jgi:hypothetical protein
MILLWEFSLRGRKMQGYEQAGCSLDEHELHIAMVGNGPG